MAAISIVSGTSLNAFFHPCENLQSIAIQPAWRRANLELLSCIAKTELYYQKAGKLGPGRRPFLSLEWAERGWSEPWGGGLVPAMDEGPGCVYVRGPSPQMSVSHLSSTSSISGQEDLQGFGTAAHFAENQLLSQLHYGWVPSTASRKAGKTDQISWYFGHPWFRNIWLCVIWCSQWW